MFLTVEFVHSFLSHANSLNSCGITRYRNKELYLGLIDMIYLNLMYNLPNQAIVYLYTFAAPTIRFYRQSFIPYALADFLFLYLVEDFVYLWSSIPNEDASEWQNRK